MKNITKSKIFLLVCLSFVAGIGIASFLPEIILKNEMIYFAFFVFFLSVSAIFFHYKKFFICCTLIAFLFAGLWRYGQFIQDDISNHVRLYNGQEVTVKGLIAEEPDISDKWQRLTVSVNGLENNDEGKSDLNEKKNNFSEIKGNILISTGLFPQYNYGDELIIDCNLEKPKNFNNFSYDSYLARYDIYSVCYLPKIEIARTNQGNDLYESILAFKEKLRNVINYGLNEPEASFARAIELGDKRGIPEELRMAFSHTGLSHIIAISGLHITLLATITMSLLLAIGVWRKWAFYATSFFIIFYVILTGAQASAIRSGVMGLLALFAMNVGRLSKMTNTLLLAAVILLFVNPMLFKIDIGFELSFLAVLGIIYVYPIIDIYLERFRLFRVRLFREILAITLASQILCWPVLAFNFSNVSFSAPIANLLVLWSSSWQMISIFFGLVLGAIVPGLTPIFFLPAKILLKFMIIIAVLLDKAPFSYLEIEYFWGGWLFFYYIILIILIWRFNREGNKKEDPRILREDVI